MFCKSMVFRSSVSGGRGDDNIKIDFFQDVGFGGMERIDVAQDRDRWPRACECGDELRACINFVNFFDKLRRWLV